MRRSTHVLGHCWRKGLVLAAVVVAFVGACWFDVAGVGRYVPDEGEVERVALQGNWDDEFTLSSPEAIAAVCDLQRDLISYGGRDERGEWTFDLLLTYHLKSGRVVHRSYPIVTTWYGSDEEAPEADDAGTKLVKRFIELADSPEGRAARYDRLLEGDLSKLVCFLEYRSADGSYDASVDIPEEERASLVEALRHDLLEEQAGEVRDHHDWEEGYDATLSVQEADGDDMGFHSLLSMQLNDKRCPRTVAWFKKHHPEIVLQQWVGEG